MDPALSVSYATIAAFLESTEGNFRQAVYVSCNCNYIKEAGCGDFLFIPGFDCKPVIIPLADIEKFMGTKVDKSECIAVLTSQSFIRLYKKWIDLTTASSAECPIRQLLYIMNMQKTGNKW